MISIEYEPAWTALVGRSGGSEDAVICLARAIQEIVNIRTKIHGSDWTATSEDQRLRVLSDLFAAIADAHDLAEAAGSIIARDLARREGR